MTLLGASGTFGSYLTKNPAGLRLRLYWIQKLSDLVRTKRDIFQFERTSPGSRPKYLTCGQSRVSDGTRRSLLPQGHRFSS